MRVQATDQAPMIQGIKGIVYGKAGVGKTMLAASCPGCCVIAAEPGLLSLRRYHIPFVEVRTVQALHDCARWITQSAEARQFGTFIFDSLSEVLEIIIAHELPRAGKEPRRAYNELLIQATAILKMYRDLNGPNIVFLTKQEYEKDGVTGAMMYQPKFPGRALGIDVPYLFDFIFQMYRMRDPQTQQEHFLFRTQPDNQFEAKDRSGNLQYIEPANLGYVLNKMNGVVT